MALTKLPNVRLYRSNLANASRVINLNFVDLGHVHTVVPTMTMNRQSISNAFEIINENMIIASIVTSIGYIPMPGGTLDSKSINRGLKIANLNFYLQSGAPLPSSPPVFGTTDIPDQPLTDGVAMTPLDCSTYFDGGTPTSYGITAVPTGLSFDTATGILSGTPSGSYSFGPIVTATNSYGSAQSNGFTVTST